MKIKKALFFFFPVRGRRAENIIQIMNMNVCKSPRHQLKKRAFCLYRLSVGNDRGIVTFHKGIDKWRDTVIVNLHLCAVCTTQKSKHCKQVNKNTKRCLTPL